MANFFECLINVYFFLLFSLRSGRVNKAANENTRISRNTRDEKWKKGNGNRWNGARRRALRVAWCRDEGETTTTVITIYTTVYDYFRNGLVRDPLFTREEGGRYERRLFHDWAIWLLHSTSRARTIRLVLRVYLPRRFATRYQAADDTVPDGGQD